MKKLAEKNKFKNRIDQHCFIAACLIFIVMLVSACTDSDNTNEIRIGSHKSSGTFALPTAVQNAESELKDTKAWITIDDGKGTPQREAMTIVGEQAQFEKTGLAEGTYSFKIEFTINKPELGDVDLANATITAVKLGEGVNSVDFSTNDYLYPDDDDDEIPNLIEIVHGTKPHDPVSKPPITCKISDGNITCNNITYTVGGVVNGLEGDGLVLQINDNETHTIDTNDEFTFPTPLNNSSTYEVTVATQPSNPDQTCSVNNDNGTINGANISNISVTCTNNPTPPSNVAPNGLIDTPSAVVTIVVGESVNFSASASDPDNHTPLSYHWDFDGGANNVTQKDPGAVTFNTAGNYTVTFTASDSLALADPTPASINVTVLGKYTIGGSVIGLSGSGLKLQINNAETLDIAADGSFSFPTSLADGSEYTVSAATQPGNPSQACSISNGSGTLDGANISSVIVNCSTDYTVGGTASGVLGNGLILQLNDTNDLAVNGDGTFTFPVLLPDAATYTLSIASQPSSPAQTCSITNGDGTIQGNDVTEIEIHCISDKHYSVGGSITGLVGDGLVLQNNGTDDLSLTANTSAFTFSTQLADGSPYKVTILNQPSPDQLCSVSKGSGTLSGEAVTNISISCVSLYNIGGTIEGLKGNNLVLQNSNGEKLSIDINDTTFGFAIKIPDGDQYDVTVLTQPSNLSQTCSVTNGSGTTNGAAVGNIVISCTTNTFSIGGTISNLQSTGLTLQNNGTDTISPASDEKSFSFTTNILDGAAYNVTITAQPGNPNQQCTVNNGAGTVKGSNITNIAIKCPVDTFASTILGSESDTSYSTVLGDVDKDGDLDLIVGNRKQTNKLYRNNGSGDFGTNGTVLGIETNDTMAAVLSDVDSDGDLDYIAANYGEPNQLYLNDGSGNYTLSDQQALGSDADFTTSVVLGDVDKDGDLDFITGNENQTNKLYFNDGKGTFTASNNVLVDIDDTRSITLGDVDDDGDLDLIVGNRGQNKLYINDGKGAFASSTPLGDETDETFSVILGDVNKDGNLDLIAGNNGINKLYLNNGEIDGVGFASSGTDISTETDNTRSITLGDMDSDGDLDLIMGNNSQTNTLYLNDGTGQFTTGDTTLGDETDSTHAVVLGDLDKDGDLDLIEGNDGQANRHYVNNLVMSANFPFRMVIGSDSKVTRSVMLGDVDGDGDLDLIAGNGFSPDNTNMLYLNEGDGKFSDSGTAISSDKDVTLSVVLGDVDGDDDLDLIAGNGSGIEGQINKLYLNDGSGKFSEIGTAIGNEEDFTYSVGLGDADGDGDLDLIAGNSGQNKLYLNDGNGKFSKIGAAIGSEEDITNSVGLCDIDGDGDLDIIAGNSGQNRLYLNDGGGNFSDSGVAIGNDKDSTHSLVAGDVDNDGDLDIAAGNYNQTNKLYLNDGEGKFADTSIAIGNDTDHTRSVMLSDVDYDGDLDLIAGNRTNNKLYLNNFSGIFSEKGTAIGGNSNSTYSVVLGDIDNDGDLDLIAGNHYQNTLHLNAASGNFAKTPPTPMGLESEDDTKSIVLSDIDDDGDLDVIVGNLGQNKFYLNDGTRDFRFFGTALGNDFDVTRSLALGDVDRDGDQDLITGNWEQTNKLYLNNDGVFAASSTAISSDTDRTYSVVLGDVDSDGHLDLIAGNYGNSKLYMNEGNGKFTEKGVAIGSATGFTNSLALGDVDGDSDLDLVLGNSNFAANVLYLNNGSGSFIAGVLTFNSNRSTSSVVLGDVDGDGDLDLVAGNSRSPNRLYRNNGKAAFDTSDIGGDDITRSIFLGDVDRDGDLDLIAGNSSSLGSGKLYLNNGSGMFAYSGINLHSNDTNSVVLGDLDGDGDLDLIVGNTGANKIYWNQ